MARWFALEPADEGFLTTAPLLLRFEKHYDAPVEQVWESLQSDESLAAWGNTVSSLTWTSPRPFGVGSTREVGTGPMRVREHFFRWDEGRGYSFYVTEANAPLFRRFAEDYVVLPDGTGTRFLWTVAVEPRHALRLPFKVLAPAFKIGFGRLASDGQRYFATR
jgi:hypothetical protein